jgi:hypothetical protein
MFGENFINTSSMEESGTMNIRITNIHVFLNTNISGFPNTPLHFNMLYHPDLEKGRYSAKEYSLPFFTDSVKYPLDSLAAKTYSERVDFFFNKNRFNKICRKSGTDYVKIDQPMDDADDVAPQTDAQKKKELEEETDILNREMENADHNVKCMLILLLPIADEFINVFQSSYEQYILNRTSLQIYTVRNIDPTMLLNPTWIPLYNYFRPRQYVAPIQEISYLKQGDTKYAITNVVWLNDLVNNPVYRDFVTVFYDKLSEKYNSRKKIKKQLRERRDVLQSLLTKYQTSTGSFKNTYLEMINVLVHNVPTYQSLKPEVIPIPAAINPREPEEIFDHLVITIYPSFNAKDNSRRETIQRICKYLSEIKDGNISTNAGMMEQADNVINAYVDFTNYNQSADKDMQITLKDYARILTELYNEAIFVKSTKRIQDFVFNKIVRLDVSEKNQDESEKPKLELDIARTISKNYPYYVKLSDDIIGRLRNVMEPARRSSNFELQRYLKQMFKPNQEIDQDEQFALVNVYNKYIANTRAIISKKVVDKYMYTGVSTVVSSSSGNDNKGANETSKEIPEIHVYLNVIKKDEYEKNTNRGCIMSDDSLTNHLKQLLYTNTMMNNTFPEVNPYRAFTFLNGADETPVNLARDSAESGDKKSNPTTGDEKDTSKTSIKTQTAGGTYTSLRNCNTRRSHHKYRNKRTRKHN